MINSSGKLSGKSPVLSIENVSECESIGKKSSDHKRKFSDAENIGRKLATLPKNFNTNQLHPNDRLNMGKSEETLTKPENTTNYGTMRANEIITAKSYQNIADSSKRELEVETSTGTSSGSSFKNNVTDDEIAKRNKLTIDQLKIQLSKTDTGKPLVTRSQSNNVTPMVPIANPSIRIQVEDTSNNTGASNNTNSTSKSRSVDRKVKHRHRSLGETAPPKSPLPPEPSRRNLRTAEQSRSLDGNPVMAASSSRSRPKCREHDLPPAPPPPNCSPRNSNGRSPLERLSKDELVNLWRSSESELRSHLLKAIRDKDTDDPP